MLVFLDIDGVMVPAKGWKTPELLEDGFPVFTQESTTALKSLLSSETRVILSTSHRYRYSVTQWKQIFEKRGLRITRLGRLASAATPSKRKDEIQGWFNSHPIPKEFIILDDDKSLHSLPESLKNHWVETPSLVGLTTKNLKEAISQLALS
ncbi:MAG: hypothetical protein HOP08_17380 [Cyclobacteriaceae bacterium]|nr:hypothetical protein [Cyclobacteriaceae bacterium]